MLARAVLAQTADLTDTSADASDNLGDPSGVAATSLSEACVALRDALSIFHGSLVASNDDLAGHADAALAKRASRRHRRARALLRRARRALTDVAAAEDLAGWVEARLGPETAPIVAGYLRMEHARGAKAVARARRDAHRAANAVLRAYPSVSMHFGAPSVERFDRVLSGHLRHSLADTSEALDTTHIEARGAAKHTRRLGLLLGLCAASDFSDAVNDDAAKALRVCHTLTRSLRPRVSAEAIETVLGAAGLSDLVDAEQIAQLNPTHDRAALGARHLELLSRVEGVIQTLENMPTDVEIERKYLLRALPPKALDAGALLQLRQGYVPGERLHERVRAVTQGDTTTYLRTIKLGRGVQRVELEETTTEAIFDALWALTEGARVLKRRYEVRDGDLVWQVDAFDNRELFLVEVELDDPHKLPALPAWLAPYVVREVTHEREYVNLNLAR
jgi:CYTH domain-containing protein